MTLIDLLIVLILIGIGLYLLNLIPMDATVKQIVRVVVIVVAVLFVLRAFGLLDALNVPLRLR